MSVEKKKIAWASSLVLDLQMHRTTQLEILKHLSIRGNDTLLIGMQSKNKYQLQGRPGPRLVQVPVRKLPLISPLIYAFVLAFLLPIKAASFNPDFVIMDAEFSILGSIPGLLVSKFRKTKFVLDIRSTPVEIHGFRGRLQQFSFDISVSFAKSFFSGFTIITQQMKKEICARFQFPPEKMGVWTSGVNIALFDPTIWFDRGNKNRTKLGLSDKFIVFYHGYFSQTRGIMEIVAAIKILKQKQPNIVLFLLGSGPIVDLLESSVKDAGLQNNVVIHDPVEYEQVPEFISMCDVGIVPLPDHPYWRNQSPLKLLEYLSMEKVVIATDIPAHRNVVGNKDCCLYLKSINPQEIANVIEFARVNISCLPKWGESGRNIVFLKYSWSKVAHQFENYLLHLQ